MSEFKEYIVTTESIEDTDSVWDDLVSTGSPLDTIPERPVEVSDERLINNLNTNYYLTEEEAEKLKSDPRVVDVFDPSSVPARKFAFQDANFSKTTGSDLGKSNWGLLRHINTTNVFGTSTADPGGTYDYVLDGTGVDVVILDSGIEANHPEWEDSQGNSRLKQVDWFQVSGVPGTMPSNFYTDYDGHGTHVAGTVAGKIFGWAKNADIYAIKLNDLKGTTDPGSGLSISTAFDVLLGWHQSKTNGRPTVINNSWGYSIFWRTNDNAFSFSLSGGTTYPVDGGIYRGTPWTGSTRDTSKGHTGQSFGSGIYGFPYRVTSTDADIAQLIAAGVIVCNSAGNDNVKADILGGVDYDNTINLTGFGTFYYHRKGSPSVGTSPGFDVGSIGTGVSDGLDTKSIFSNSGPGVTIWAAGSRILSAMSQVNSGGTNFPYNGNSSFKQEVYSGTSMASPQVAGMAALLLQAHPDWTPSQVVNWMISNSQPQLRDTGATDGYALSTLLHGGYNRLCYMPMNGQRPFSVSEV